VAEITKTPKSWKKRVNITLCYDHWK